jgi:hypothetical protein
MLSVIMVILVPSIIFAASAHKFAVGSATTTEANQIVVPLVVTNEANLTALDIPLKYSEGVTLKEVDFENTRVSCSCRLARRMLAWQIGSTSTGSLLRGPHVSPASMEVLTFRALRVGS